MAPLTSIRTEGDKIEIVNQLLLPHTTEWIPIESPADAYEAINSMKIRGAPAIGSLAALSIASHLSWALKQSPPPTYLATPESLKAHLDPLLNYLFKARPTAVNLGEAMKRISTALDKLIEEKGQDVTKIVDKLIAVSRAVADEDVGRNKEMSRKGAEWLLEEVRISQKVVEEGGKINVLTVCNTGSLATSGVGTALGIITHLHDITKLHKAYYAQTSPYHQGTRLTSLELLSLGIPSVMICDTMVGSLFQHHNIHAVIVGADRIAKNGDTANKIGTYQAAVLAARHKIPFIVAAPVTTVDLEITDGSKIPIEHRPAVEACLARGAVYPPSPNDPTPKQVVVMITPSNIDLDNGVYNPSFDVTPAELITAIVTEKGVAIKKEGAVDFDLSAVV